MQKILSLPSSYVLGRLRALASKKIRGPILITSDSKHGSPGLRALRHLPEDVGGGSFQHISESLPMLLKGMFA